ncbi:Hypothetical Protein FCC1311_050462 [Hondaea fermentalgiana]|uniref:Uncharacterized protein n=1 Tax=Hondaea fermentalgiana TaxID=2315210 RepID=A0A2R5GE25_9STRA|nr:Hypothetical Protein FCC1311_050462 [Hondaea fermentalgiana]|eukprot:GBG28825.1 Hypothetical Protein FCC1311_050462 [Hondaea fermentalgiana]
MRRSTGDEAGGGEGVSAGGQSAEGSLYFLPDNLIADEVAPSQDSQLGQHDLETHETIPSLRTYSGPKETTEKLRRVRLPPPRPLPSLQPQPQPQPQLQHHQQQQQQQQEQQQHQQQQHQQHALPLQEQQHQQLHNDNHRLLVPTTELQDASTTGLPSLDATAYLGQQQEHHVQQPNLFEMSAVFRPIASVPPGGDHDQHATPDFGGFLGRQPEQSLQQQPQLDPHGHVILEEEEPRSRRSSNVLELLSEAMPDHHLRAPFVTGTESSLRPTAQDFEPQFARAEMCDRAQVPVLHQAQEPAHLRQKTEDQLQSPRNCEVQPEVIVLVRLEDRPVMQIASLRYLCMNETRRAAIFQFVLPVLFVLEGVSRPSYLLVLAPAELLMLAFCILILRDDRLHFNLRLLLTVSGHIIMALTVGDYFLVQWFLVVSQLDFLASTSLTKVVSSP